MKRIVLVLKSGGDFNFEDVRLLTKHIRLKWKSEDKLEILCFWDMALMEYDFGFVKIIPLPNDYPGVWARHILYSPEIEHLKPFLYLDLDTAVIQDVNNIFKLVEPYKDKFITLEDFWQNGKLATGVVWFPSNCAKTKVVYDKWNVGKGRMDYFLRLITKQDLFWQQLTNSIVDFKPRPHIILYDLPSDANLVCFHGKPRIGQAAENVDWVKKYVME